MKLAFSLSAKADLREMLRYGTYHWGRERALRFLDQFIMDLDVLTEYPNIGKKDGDYRELASGNYRTLYQVDGDTVTVMAIEPKGRSED